MKSINLTALVHLCAVILLMGPSVDTFAQDSKPAEKGLFECKMVFNLKGWSAFYKTANGHGTITCTNGQTAKVRIAVKGGGVTFGKFDIIHGTGTFTPVRTIDEVFGSYAHSEAHAGVGRSGAVQAMTKGEVSLALAGTGRGIDIGFDFGRFTITRAK